MRLNYDEHFCPCNDVVFSVMFSKSRLFCPLVSAVTGDVVELAGEPHSQAVAYESDAALNKVQFDTFAAALNNKLYSADMQRSYKRARQTRRTVYYVCRAVSAQEVKNMAYEDVAPVNISFILEDHNDRKRAVRHVKLCDVDTHEVYDDLIEITVVSIPAVLRESDKGSNLYLFARFFDISSQEEADAFVKEFEPINLAKELIGVYNNAVANAQDLRAVESSPYYTARLNEAQLEEERKKTAYQTAVNAAKKFLVEGVSPETVAKCVGIDISTIHSLQKALKQ
jgi:predicted transposase/invertase (TIGR01784 family)